MTEAAFIGEDQALRVASERALAFRNLQNMAVLEAIAQGWVAASPQAVFDEFDRLTPDHPQQFMNHSNAAYAAENIRPTSLELYFLSKLTPDTGFVQDSYDSGAFPVMASIMCLRDQIRTKRFLQGVRTSTDNVLAETSGPIHVIEAGTGAIPSLLIQAAVRSERVHGIGLELNPRSAMIAQQIVTALDLHDRIAIVQADAMRYQPEQPIDLLISETMHSGLASEPLVQIFDNLQPYVKPEGITLPTAVDILAGIVSVQEYASPEGHVVFPNAVRPQVSIPWHRVARYIPGQRLDRIAFSIPVGEKRHGGYMPLIASEVEIGEGKLALNDSFITAPRVLGKTATRRFDFGGSEGVTEVRVSYVPGQNLIDVAELITN